MPLLFSYGTLQRESVQLSTLGRTLGGEPDALIHAELSTTPIRDPRTVARFEKTHHANVVFNGNSDNRVAGTVLDVTDADLSAIDGYEAGDAYARRRAMLASSREAWVYVYSPELDAVPGGPLTVRRAAIGDEPILRGLRLQALTYEPMAFGSTFERERARTVADWQRWLSPGATFLLERAGIAVGLVASRCADDDPSIADLMALWVAPWARGCGGGDALVRELMAWARKQEASTVRLLVIAGNDHAKRLYERNGFRPTGHEHAREPDGRIELQMECRLD
jgi:ribosomal protein S18 acetylase RimI-like enzyme